MIQIRFRRLDDWRRDKCGEDVALCARSPMLALPHDNSLNVLQMVLTAVKGGLLDIIHMSASEINDNCTTMTLMMGGSSASAGIITPARLTE